MKRTVMTRNLKVTGKIAGVIILATGLCGSLNATEPKNNQAESVSPSGSSKLLCRDLCVSQPPSPGVATYSFKPDGKCHAMLLEVQPIDLSQATDLRFEIKADPTFGEIDVTLRDKGDLISETIKIAKYVTATNDGYQVVQIPATAFKTKGWNMKSVKLMFVGGMNTVINNGPSFSIRAIEAGFPKSVAADASDASKIFYRSLCLARPPSSGVASYTFQPDGKCHAMLMELQPIDLSKADEVGFEIKADPTFGGIDVTLRDKGELISDSVNIAKYVKETNDGYQVVRIPAAAFKTKGWNMKSVKLMFVGRSTTVVQGGPSFTIRAIEAGFQK